jgi:hypothetical protein
MSGQADYETQQLRRETLIIVRGASGKRANEHLVRRVLNDGAHAVSQDRVRTELAWLGEQGLVTVREIGGVMLATLTQRGSDVIDGSVETPGVEPPPLD